VAIQRSRCCAVIRIASEGRHVPADHGFVFIRSASAAGFGLRALNRQDWSSSSNLTSTNVLLLTSPPPEKRKVGGSIPPLATRVFTEVITLKPRVGGASIVVGNH
jgi:hypothetical protein